jgi:hypothetical protein
MDDFCQRSWEQDAQLGLAIIFIDSYGYAIKRDQTSLSGVQVFIGRSL